jgi:hypothetical protein
LEGDCFFFSNFSFKYVRTISFPFSGISNMLSLRLSREPGRLVDRERAWKHFNIGVELCLHYPHISLFINRL